MSQVLLYLQAVMGATFAVRPLFVSVAQQQNQQDREEEGSGRKEERRKDSLAVTDEDINAITDQIPQRPMGVVEGTSYTVIIFAALAFAGMQDVSTMGFSFLKLIIITLTFTMSWSE